jgi:signal transduction histidine kinase
MKTFAETSVNNKFKLNIFRIVQEQLNNILKYAKATKIIISLLQNQTAVTLIISDNGIGFDTSKKQKGIGMANIKSRAGAYNGHAGFISEPGKGCVLTVAFSLSALRF